jgi:hypothetical protein
MTRTIVRKKDEAMGEGESAPSDKKAEFLGKLANYIPAEITAAYLFVIGIINGVTDADPIILWISLIVLLIASPLYLLVVAKQEKKTPDKAQIIISVPAFLIWAFAIGGPFVLFDWYNPAYGAVLVGLATVIIPLVDYLVSPK